MSIKMIFFTIKIFTVLIFPPIFIVHFMGSVMVLIPKTFYSLFIHFSRAIYVPLTLHEQIFLTLKEKIIESVKRQ